MKTNSAISGWIFHRLYFVTLNPMDLEVILKTCLEKDNVHRFLQKLIGYGGAYAPVYIWKNRRKMTLLAFTTRIVDTYVEVFSQQSQIIVKRLANIRNNINVWPFISAYALDSVCETTMGIHMKAQTNSNLPFLIMKDRIMHIICERMYRLWLQPDWLYKFFPQYTQHQECIQYLHNYTDEIIQKKRAELINEKQIQGNDLCHKRSLLNILSSLSGGKKAFTDLAMREEILTLTIAGTDTTAISLSHTFRLLAKYPQVQEKAYREIQQVFGDSNRPIEKRDLKELKYLERVIKESLRLYPPGPFVFRKIDREITLPSGLTLPADSGVVVSILGCHRDPKYWGPEAEHFDPDRFLPERFNLKHACSYMPFSNGPRNCIAQQYAMISIKTALATILKTYEVVGEQEIGPIPYIRVKLDIMMKAVDECDITFKRRNIQ